MKPIQIKRVVQFNVISGGDGNQGGRVDTVLADKALSDGTCPVEVFADMKEERRATSKRVDETLVGIRETLEQARKSFGDEDPAEIGPLDVTQAQAHVNTARERRAALEAVQEQIDQNQEALEANLKSSNHFEDELVDERGAIENIAKAHSEWAEKVLAVGGEDVKIAEVESCIDELAKELVTLKRQRTERHEYERRVADIVGDMRGLKQRERAKLVGIENLGQIRKSINANREVLQHQFDTLPAAGLAEAETACGRAGDWLTWENARCDVEAVEARAANARRAVLDVEGAMREALGQAQSEAVAAKYIPLRALDRLDDDELRLFDGLTAEDEFIYLIAEDG